VERRGEGADRGREPGAGGGDLGRGAPARSAAAAAVDLAAPGEAGTPRAAGGGAVVRAGGRRERCTARRALGCVGRDDRGRARWCGRAVPPEAQLAGQNEPLRAIVKELQRARFGRRSEKAAHPDQLQLALEDLEQASAEGEAEAEKSDRVQRAARPRQRRGNRGALAKHLPRDEVVIEPDEQTCPCGGGEIHRIGEDVAERLDVIPAQFRVIVTRHVETMIRGQAPEQRQAVRQEQSKPVVDDLRTWLDAQLAKVPRRARIAEASRYALKLWSGLRLFLDDGRIEIDTNAVERAIRPIALNRKNALFAGSDQGGVHCGVIASLIEPCKLNAVDPQAYLADVLSRLVNRHPASQIDQLMPWAYPSQVA
jgi:Transposase IS66 family/IS66 C-terminal element/Transposase C of IS166 homeodomain/zinc-finger binding domain of transposase IS66